MNGSNRLPTAYTKAFSRGVLVTLVALGVRTLRADPPPGYYDSVDATNSTTLRATLHPVIDDHTRFPYTSAGTDTWNILELADQNPDIPANIIDVYKNATYLKVGAGNPDYEREHTWPSSYGFPNDVTSNYPYTDCHHLFLCNGSYNGSRSNKPYRYCSAACSEQPTDVNNGRGGGTGVYPGNSNWTSGSFTAGTWETWIGRRGDVARAQMYLDIRYEGGTHGGTGAAEPNLILTDSEALIASGNTGSNESIAYMGILSVLLQWHQEDPVDTLERARNDVVAGFQGNRNPFIDHPEWVECLFNNNCSNPPPAAPTALAATPGAGVVDLDWADNTEPDLAGYNVYRGTTSGGPYTLLNGSLLTQSLYSDTTVTNGTTYFYAVTAVDTGSAESALSAEVSATPSGGGSPEVPWINELHYDNTGTDTNEGVEVAGPAGTSLAGWQLLGYNGNGNTVYSTTNLSGSIANQQNGSGTVWFAIVGLQNGAPDGVALVDNLGAVVQFLSYEGVMTAADGPAAGLTSVDLGVSQSGSGAVGLSLQLQGTGSQYADFTWAPEAAHTRGLINNNQTFIQSCTVPADCDDGLFCNGPEPCVGGVCQTGTAPNCNDAVGCTTDACNETTDTCDHTPVNSVCDNGLFCDGAESCHPTLGCQAGTPPDCADSVACTVDSCNETTDTCDHAPNNAACSDGIFCNGAETCNVTLGCQAGGDPCPGQLCDEPGDRCVDCFVNANCDDGLFCNGSETCSDGICQAGTAPNCADAVACTVDSCNETADTCDHTPSNALCDDGLFCNGAETCNITLGCQAGTDPCAPEPCDESGDTCGAPAPVVWLSFNTATAVPGVGTVDNEDLVAYDLGTDTWSLVFDGSDVGLGSFVIDGMAVQASGDILLSFTSSGSIPGMTGGPGGGTTLDDSDIVRFVPTVLGSTTAGSFVFYFDASDVGLADDAEDVDAIALAADGRLILSVLGNFAGTGAGGADEDLFLFNNTSLGATTAGSFQIYFDGSDVSLTAGSEDVDAAGLALDGGILLSTEGAFSVTGVSGADEDVLEFTPTSTGATTAGSYAMFLDLSTMGISTAANVGSVELRE